MTMTVATPPISPEGNAVIIDGVDWETYSRLLGLLGDKHVFLTYDRGRLEIMSPSRKHDKCGRYLGLLVHLLADGFDMALDGGGSTTYRRQDLERGLEPDECFYIANEQKVRGKEEIDLSIDPPPDLAIEVEISRRLKERQDIYAALGVPELWCFDGATLRVLLLSSDGAYRPSDRSLSFPQVPVGEIERLAKLAWTMDEIRWARAVRGWITSQFGNP